MNAVFHRTTRGSSIKREPAGGVRSSMAFRREVSGHPAGLGDGWWEDDPGRSSSATRQRHSQVSGVGRWMWPAGIYDGGSAAHRLRGGDGGRGNGRTSIRIVVAVARTRTGRLNCGGRVQSSSSNLEHPWGPLLQLASPPRPPVGLPQKFMVPLPFSSLSPSVRLFPCLLLSFLFFFSFFLVFLNSAQVKPS